jgi:hypothetical protein
VLINRTPSTSDVVAYRDHDKDLNLSGSGLEDYTTEAPKKGGYAINVNVTTPYCPITSDGKAPNLDAFADEIFDTVTAAMKKAQRAAPKDRKRSIKDVVLDSLDEVIAAVSADGEYRFNSRQLLYQLRPIVREELDVELKLSNFTGIIDDYENDSGEIPGMYREPRGSIYHPHRGETKALGTLMVEEYERPLWTFNKLVYIEKEGFSEALKDDGWPERHDCALISSKGFSTRAARDLIDKLAEHDEPVTVFCVHDADGPGTMIYQTLLEATKARGARKIEIENLGLEPWEAIADDLEVEEVERGKTRKAVADYVVAREDTAPDDEEWEEWLQTHRVELNAMTTPEFIEWLDAKMAAYKVGKLIPPADALAAELEQKLIVKVRAQLTEQILREGGFEVRVAAAMNAIKRPTAAALAKGIKVLFKRDPAHEWRDHIETVATDRVKKA